MSFEQSYKAFWKNYAKFDGTATRSEYWWPTIINALIVSALLFCGILLIAIYQSVNFDYQYVVYFGGFLIFFGILFAFAMFIPQISVSVRRLHDAGFSGYMYLFVLIPPGDLILIFFYCMPSKLVDNVYATQSTEEDSNVLEPTTNISINEDVSNSSLLSCELEKLKKLFNENIINSEEYTLLRKKTIDEYLNKKM